MDEKKNRIKSFVIAVLIVGLLMAFVVMTRGIVFETVDDFNVMYTIAGYKSGAPFWQVTFYNTLLAALQAGLYRLYDGIQWYALIQFGMLGASNVALLFTLLESGNSQIKTKIIRILAFIIFFFAVLMYPVQRMQFTTTSGMLGVAAIALLFLATQSKKKKDWVFSGLFLIGSFMERRMVGAAMIAIWFGYLIVCFICEKKVERKQLRVIAIIIAITGVLIVGINTVDQYIKNNLLNADYMEYDDYRGMFQDYQKPSYWDNVELYNSVGWDEDIYYLVGNLIYIDESINENAFRTLVESDAFQRNLSVSQAVHLVKDLIVRDTQAKVALGAFVFAFLANCLIFTRKKVSLRALIRVMYPGVVWCGLMAYLSISGRMPLRVFLIVTIPCICISLFNLLQTVRKARIEAFYWKVCFIPAMVVLALASSYHVYFTLQSKDEYSRNIMTAFETYAIQHPDNIYVHDYTICNEYNSYNPFHVYRDQYPTNVIISGGSYTYTACYYEQLRINGLQELTGETLLQDNVYYVCDLSRHGPDLVCNYLNHHVAPVESELVDVLEGNVGIFRITRWR